MSGAPFPRSLGQFSVVSPLGRGEGGQLYLGLADAEHPCVLKVIGRSVENVPQLLGLHHPNLVRVLDVIDSTFHAVALELVAGRDLGAVLYRLAEKERRLPLPLSGYVMQRILAGLAVAQRSTPSLVHGALDPSQVLISWTGEVKLLGCGLARPLGPMSSPYAPPEQVEGGAPDTTWDVWALGMMWKMMSEHPSSSTLSLEARGQLVEIEEVMWRAMAIDPADRWPTALEFGEALAALRLPLGAQADLAALLSELWPGEAEREAALYAERQRESLWSEGEATGPHAREAWTASEVQLDPGRPISETTLPEVPHRLSHAASTGDPGRRGLDESETDSISSSDEQTEERHTPLRIPRASRAATPSWSLARNAFPDVESQGMAGPGPGPGRGAEAARAMSANAEPEQGATTYLGKVLAGRYRLDKLIGKGGMGWVYEAEHVEIGKKVAVKVLRPRYSNDAEQVARFRSEARAASLIGHPNIIDVLDFGTTDQGNFFLVMELLQGCDLAEVLQQEVRLSPSRAVHICAQVCRAVAAAHEAGIIHRDLKPGNIFLAQRDGNIDFVKVLDFGIATSMTEGGMRRLTAPGLAIGTPEYMAPEQASGGSIDQRVDVYAVGAILYEMLTGTPPHGGGNALTVLSRKVAEMPLSPRELNQEIPESLAEAVMGALERDPVRRIGSMRALEYEITKSMKGRGSAVAALLGLKKEASAWQEGPGGLGSPMPAMAPAGDFTPDRKTEPLRPISDEPVVSRSPEPSSPSLEEQIPTIEREGTGAMRRRVIPTPSQDRTIERPLRRSPGRMRGLWWLVIGGLVLFLGVSAVLAMKWKEGRSAQPGPPQPTEPVHPVETLPPAPPPIAPQEASHFPEKSKLLEPLLGRARLAVERGNFLTPPVENLRELLRRIATLDPENTTARQLRMSAVTTLDGRAQRAWKRNDLEAMERFYRTAFALDPDDPKVRSQLVMTLCLRSAQQLRRSRLGGALDDAMAAVQLAPNDIHALISLGNAYLATRRYEQAIAEYRHVLELSPQADVTQRLEQAERGLQKQGRRGRRPPAL
ncbi:MAG TPA: protein kinase [Polyangia bacterium]|nr:protein kinase [Polyangia bacterium]